MSHGLAATVRNSLKQHGNSCDTERHELQSVKFEKRLILLAIPAGFEPATRGVEIRYSIRIGRQFHEKRDALANILANKLLDTEEERVAQKVSWLSILSNIST